MRIFPALLALLLSGCAIGNKFDYESVRAPIPQTAKKTTVAVATIDRREYLIKSQVADKYVGMTRNGYGIPYRVSTKSGAPLAVDLSKAIVASLNDSGYRAEAVSGFPVLDQAAAKAQLFSSPANRRILVTVNTWESDTLVNTELETSVTVEVFDQTGKLLASEFYSAKKGLGGNFISPIVHARQSVLDETSRIIAQMFSSQKIQGTL